MDQLFYARAFLDPEHLIGDLRHVLGRDFKTRLLVLQEILDVLYLRKFEKGIQLSFCIEKDIQRLDLFPAFRGEVGGVTLENVGKIYSQPIDLVAAKGIHVIFRYQCSFPLLDPGKLDLLVPVQVRVKMGKHVLLYDDRFVMRHRDGKLKYFHRWNFSRQLRNGDLIVTFI